MTFIKLQRGAWIDPLYKDNVEKELIQHTHRQADEKQIISSDFSAEKQPATFALSKIFQTSIQSQNNNERLSERLH